LPVGASISASALAGSHSVHPTHEICGYLQCSQRSSWAILDRVMSLRLLIVDDNIHFLESARGLLDSESVSVVGVATSSAEGLWLAAELRPDVTLVDIDLGEESGFDLARKLMAAQFASEQKVILTSAYPEEDFAELIETSPAIAFVSKSELSTSTIIALIGRRQSEGDHGAT
jgi:DNA-binding NarL/FixJ family response regulator